MKSDVVSSCGNSSICISLSMATSAIRKKKHEVCSQDANKARGEVECFIGIETAAEYFILCIARARLRFNCFKELTRECLVKVYQFQVLPVYQLCYLG